MEGRVERRGVPRAETTSLIGLGALLTMVVVLALVLEALGGALAFVLFLLSIALLTIFAVLLLRPEAMGLPRWWHRFQLRRYTLPGSDALYQSLNVATLETLPSQRAMLLLEVRGLLLDLLALRFGSRRRSPRALMAMPRVDAFLHLHPPLLQFLHITEALAENPEALIVGWSDLNQVDFANRLGEVVARIREDFG